MKIKSNENKVEIVINKEALDKTGMPALRKIFDNLSDGTHIKFEKDEYHFYNDDSYYEWFSDLTCNIGYLNIVFYLKDRSDITIDGGGSEFIFHGRLMPFLLKNCRNVVLKNFTIDYDRPFYSQADITGADEKGLKIKFAKGFPWRVEGNNLVLYSDDWENRLDQCITLLQEFDKKTNAPAYTSDTILCRIGDDVKVFEDAPLAMSLYKAKELDNGEILLYGDHPIKFTPGNVIVFAHEGRENSAINLYECDTVTINNIYIRHSGAFGIMGVATKDLTIDGFCTALDEKSKGIVSTNADSVHIIHCYGNLIIRNCIFENMLDDAVNVHGLFHEVVARIDDHTFKVACKLWGYNGLRTYKKGTQIQIYKHNTISKKCLLTIADVTYLPDHDYGDILLRVEEEIGDDIVDCLVDNFEMMPRLHIYNVKTGNNRPRGFLIQTNKPVIVENCEFYNSNFAINITSDCTYWYEAGPVSDVTIRNNIFRDCNYSWGEAPIAITPEYDSCDDARYFHKNITVCDNEFYSFTGGMIYAIGVDGLSVKNNKFVTTNTYPRRFNTPKYTIRNCDNCELE